MAHCMREHVSKRSETACINKETKTETQECLHSHNKKLSVRYLHVCCMSTREKGKITQEILRLHLTTTICYNNINANTSVWSYLLYTYNVSQRTVVHYLNHVHPLSNIKKALLTGDVVQQQHTIRPAEVRLCNAVEPEGGRYRHTKMCTVRPLISHLCLCNTYLHIK